MPIASMNSAREVSLSMKLSCACHCDCEIKWLRIRTASLGLIVMNLGLSQARTG